MPEKTKTNREPAQEQDKQAMETSLETLVLILGSFCRRLPQACVPLSCVFFLLFPGFLRLG